MKKTTHGEWAELKARSQQGRRQCSMLVDDVVRRATTTETDAIGGAAALLPEIEAWKAFVAEAADRLRSAAEALTHTASVQADSFHERLKAAFAEANLEVYGDQSLFVVDGLVHVAIDTRKGTVLIDDEIPSSFTIFEIVKAAQTRLAEVSGQVTPVEQFLTELSLSYRLDCVAESKEHGTQIQTLSLLPRIALMRQRGLFRSNPTKEQFSPYPYHLFRADLYCLLKSGTAEVQGQVFRYASGSDTKGSVFMLVPALGRTAHVGRIWFEKDGL